MNNPATSSPSSSPVENSNNESPASVLLRFAAIAAAEDTSDDDGSISNNNSSAPATPRLEQVMLAHIDAAIAAMENLLAWAQEKLEELRAKRAEIAAGP